MTWERSQLNWIATLSDSEVLIALQNVMEGHGYSWHTIAKQLQTRVNNRSLQLEHFEPGNIPYEWNVLCDEKTSWTRNKKPSFLNLGFNRACLFNLRTIPTRAFGKRGKLKRLNSKL